MWRIVLSGLVFAALMPGVLVTLPSKSSSKKMILLVHAVLFAVLLHILMRHLRYESFGLHGPASCPAGFEESHDAAGERCVPSAGTRQNPPGSVEKK